MHWPKIKITLRSASNVAMLGLIFIAICLIGVSRFSSRALFVIPANKDLGRIHGRPDLLTQVYIINLSLNTVDINCVPSCGCSTVSTTQRRLSPLTIGVADIKITTKYLKRGRHAKYVLIEFRHNGVEWGRDACVRFLI